MAIDPKSRREQMLAAGMNPELLDDMLDTQQENVASSVTTKSITENITGGYTDKVLTGDIPSISGTNSLFNNYVVFRVAKNGYGLNKAEYNETSHYLTNLNDQYAPEASTPTAAKIIKWSQDQKDENSVFGPAPYSWNDFLYCKHYGKIPNNYMITLRRYPMPVLDNLKGTEDQILVPIAQSVSWLGEDPGNSLKDILKFTYGYNWEELKSEVQNIDGNETQFGSGIEQFAPDKIQKALGLIQAGQGNGDWDGRKENYNEWAKGIYDPSSGSFQNRVYGPVNVIDKTHMRTRGLKFDNPITVKFHYKLNSYDKISPKVAMLDIISNFLLLTFSNAKFWGGARRYFPKSNKVGFLGDQNLFYSGKYYDSIKSQLGAATKGGESFLSKLFSGAGLEELIKGGLNLAMGNLASQSRPKMLSVKSLLTGEPIGEWHLAIGNPLNPIAVIGNLILDDSTLEFSEKLGAEDFPTEVTFTVKLKHGKPRDKGDIESMLNLGTGRMYYSTLGQLPSERNTFPGADVNGIPTNKNTAETLKKDNDSARGNKRDVDVIRDRVKVRWGEYMANNPALPAFIDGTKTNF